MTRSVRPCILALCLLGICSFASGAEIALFDGKNLDHFYTFIKDRGRDVDPKGVFSVRDGNIVITGEEWGCITTRESFKDYHLVTEFKWTGPTHGNRIDRARDSGILVHSQGEDGAYSGTWMYGIEVQIIEGGTGDFLVVADNGPEHYLTAPVAEEKQGSSWLYDPKGHLETIHSGRINWWGRDPKWEDVINFRGAEDVEHPVGEWNRLEVIAVGRTITVFLNGVLVNQCVDVQPREGRIQIQAEGAEIAFRKVTLTTLAVDSETETE